MDCRYYALIHHDDLRAHRPDRVDIKDYLEAITRRLINECRYRRDRVIRGCHFADSAFAWSELDRIIRIDRYDRGSLEMGALEPLNKGITIRYIRIGECNGLMHVRRDANAHESGVR